MNVPQPVVRIAAAVVCLAAAVAAHGATPEEKIAARAPVAAINAKTGVAVKGYDVVAYFTDGKPVRGTEQETFEWRGARWQFASAGHRAKFMADPEKYAPQYGGYCAFAVSLGKIVDIDPNQWKIVDGRLYLNANLVAQTLWVHDPAGHIKEGDANWKIIPQRLLTATRR